VTTAGSMFVRLNDVRCGLDRSRFYDWAMRLPIVGYSFFVLSHDVLGFCEQAAQAAALSERPDGAFIIATLARVSQWITVALLTLLPIFRQRPIAKSESVLPRIGALLTVSLAPLFMLLDRAPADLVINSVSVILSITANVFSAVTVSFLGRSLSVMPEARQLVKSGPYKIVRHPLYLCEILGVVATLLQYRSLSATALSVLIVTLQVARALWEEAVLVRAFPDFAAYRSHTPFLIPRNPVRLLTMFFVDPIARRRSVMVVAGTIGLLMLVLVMLPRLA